MSERSFADLRWWDHRSAVWWIGLLYRRPHRFRAALEGLPRTGALAAGLLILAHALPHVLIIAGLGQWVLLGLLELPPRDPIAADEPGLSLHAWLLVEGTAFGIAFGIAVGIVGGITEGISMGISVGVALGIAFGIASLRAYYQPMHLWFVWPAVQARWYPYHPVAWDDLCSLPFVGLHRLLVGYAEIASEAAGAEIVRLIAYPSQRMQAPGNDHAVCSQR